MPDTWLISPPRANSPPAILAAPRPPSLPDRPRDVFDEPVLKELLDPFAPEQGVLRQAALKVIVKGW